ncbi:MAG: asparaginyl-tRNA synthetase [Hyphomicrobiales bacterium]|nr:asparaginyl-tRNA synthetase [Hyphomicrobiales bacterium]
MTPSASPWWDPSVYADRRPFLRARGRIRGAVRAFFEAAGFEEVETAALQVSPGNEAHIGGFATDLVQPDGVRERFYLHSSPEFACKKLLAAGETRIFAMAHVFRNGERGPLHHPEFTMLEWYRARETYSVLIDDCMALLAVAAEAAGQQRFVWRDVTCDPHAAPERLCVREAFSRYAAIDLEATLGDRDALAREARRIGLRVTPDDSWADLFSKVLSDRIEPRLGHGRATVLDLYPASEAALARRSPSDSRFAERFELYACGVELANAFGELTDAAEQRRRFELEMGERRRIYGEDFPLDEDFLAALAHMPEASGIAMGFDRLVMLATGARRIEDVLWTPVAGSGARAGA